MILAFILDGVISRYLFSAPLLTLLTLIFIYKNNKRYTYTLIIGILYDVIYTDTLFLNTFLFFISLLLVERIFKYLKFNLINVTVTSVLLIVLYRFITYFILLLLGYLEFNYLNLLIGILISLINVIYVFIIYFCFYIFNNPLLKRT